MIFSDLSKARVFLYLGKVDMRKQINGLQALVISEMKVDPMEGDLFVFCRKRRDSIKILYWDKNGYCLWQKRLEEHKFKWPKNAQEVLNISQEELSWLLRGLDFRSAHCKLTYSSIV